MGIKKLLFLMAGIGLGVFLLTLSASSQSSVLCSFAGPDVSEDLMRLTNFSIAGPSSLKVGDSITVKFSLQNYGQYDLKLGKRGIFAAAKDPDNLDTSFGFTKANTTLKVGEIVSVEVSKILDKTGTWKIWPSYQILSEKKYKLGPNEWHACFLKVAAVVKDSDQDGISDDKDNCPNHFNKDQSDIDKDGVGDVCDNCPNKYNPKQEDKDYDGVGDVCDNCPDVANASQRDSNQNGIGDECEVAVIDEAPKPKDTTPPKDTAPSTVTIKDSDKDGIPDEKDNCPQHYNPKQEDIDKDGIGDVCDKCPNEPENYNQYQDDDGCPDEVPKPKTEEVPVPVQVKIPKTITINLPTAAGPQPRNINTPDRSRVTDGPIMPEAFDDGDGDGVINILDRCPGTPPGKPVFENGCRCQDTDNGINTMVRGRLSYKTEDGRIIHNDDQCLGGGVLLSVIRPSQLQEFYCNPDYETGRSNDASLSQIINCDFGCENGRCKKMHSCSSIGGGSCADGVQNQDETGIDCGGKCPPCNTRCTTGTKYAPADTPCTTHYPTDPHRVDFTWTNSDLELNCQYYEVCHRNLDFVIEEALNCCSKTTTEEINSTVEPNLCLEALKAGGTSCKKCVGLYIIKGLGTYARWMTGYNWLYHGTPTEDCPSCGGCVNGACAYTGVESVPAEMLINDFRTGVCRDYSLAVATLLRKAGYTQHEVGNFCDGAHCYNLVKFPGSIYYHVVDTTGNNHDIELGRLPSGYDYCRNLDESNWCYKVRNPERQSYYYTGPIADIDEYWRIVDSGRTYEYSLRPFCPASWSDCDKCIYSYSNCEPGRICDRDDRPCPAEPSRCIRQWTCDDVCGGEAGSCPAGISCLPESGPGVAFGRDNFRVPDFAPSINQIIGCRPR